MAKHSAHKDAYKGKGKFLRKAGSERVKNLRGSGLSDWLCIYCHYKVVIDREHFYYYYYLFIDFTIYNSGGALSISRNSGSHEWL